MKRFDFAAEVCKQLLVMSTALVALDATFMEKFLKHTIYIFSMNLIAIILFIASAGFGILALGSLVELVQSQESADSNIASETKELSSLETREAGIFVSLAGSHAESMTKVQQIFFVLGLILFVLAAALGWIVASDGSNNTSDNVNISTPTPKASAARAKDVCGTEGSSKFSTNSTSSSTLPPSPAPECGSTSVKPPSQKAR